MNIGVPIVMWNPDSWITPNIQNTQKKGFGQCLSETEAEDTPYRYVRTFKEVERPKLVTEMDKDELQAFINELLGAKGLDTTIPKTNTN